MKNQTEDETGNTIPGEPNKTANSLLKGAQDFRSVIRSKLRVLQQLSSCLPLNIAVPVILATIIIMGMTTGIIITMAMVTDIIITTTTTTSISPTKA